MFRASPVVVEEDRHSRTGGIAHKRRADNAKIFTTRTVSLLQACGNTASGLLFQGFKPPVGLRFRYGLIVRCKMAGITGLPCATDQVLNGRTEYRPRQLHRPEANQDSRRRFFEGLCNRTEAIRTRFEQLVEPHAEVDLCSLLQSRGI